MNANTPITHTQAETGLIARYDSARTGLSGPDAVTALRDAAAEQLRQKGLPHRRVEEYKYTDLRAFMKSSAPLAPVATTDAAKAVLDAAGGFGELDRYRIVIANGRFVEALSDAGDLAGEGVTVTDFNAALGADGAALLAIPASADGDGTLALNTAFVQGGVMLSVREGAEISKRWNWCMWQRVRGHRLPAAGSRLLRVQSSSFSKPLPVTQARARPTPCSTTISPTPRN